MLARSQGRHRALVGAVADEMKASQSLDRHDRAVRQPRRHPATDPAPRRATGALAPAAGPPAPATGPPVPATGAPSAASTRTDGPQRGQAFGWAWKRRSPGSWYSRRQSAHMANTDIVVRGRS